MTSERSEVLSVLPLRGMLVFPQAAVPLVIGQERSVRLVDDAMRRDRRLVLVAQRDTSVEQAGPDDLYTTGTLATILQMARGPDGKLRAVVQGVERVRLREFMGTDPYLTARIEVIAEPEAAEPGVEVEALRRAMLDLFRQLIDLTAELPGELAAAAEALPDTRRIVYLIASVAPLALEARQELLELDGTEAKARRLIELLQHEVAVRELGRKISTETEERLSKTQRDFFLREQMRSIQQELGEENEDASLGELRQKVETLPEEARTEAMRELNRLATIPPVSPEHGMIRTYLDWMVELPWHALSGAEIEIGRAREVLDAEHYDLEKIKDRILEYLSVRKLRLARAAQRGLAEGGRVAEDSSAGPLPVTETDETARDPIICFVGPPGVGKTSLGQSIAHAMGRKFVRMSLGGVRDEAEIRGHRRTYIGAMPGRIIQALRRVGTRDPVFMLDEIDKLAADWRGDPTAALLEVLDPAQNNTFADTYLGVPFDLSQVLFIATANTLATVPAPLLDRMEVLQIAGYTEEEKLRIAQRYLIPKQRAAHGLTEGEVTFEEDAIRHIIRGYTREAGVRNLERPIATIYRKVARAIAEGKNEPVRVTVDTLDSYLGPRRFFEDVAERTDRPGVATGLAWTPVGGEILFVEAAIMPQDGEPRLILTGMLGDVMRESAQAALSYLRSDAERLGIDPAAFQGKTVHLHVPSGAIPKDGPSAGVAMLAALASLASRRPVRGDVAMTGEITLRGKVLPVGGIKEKVLAAHRAGIQQVILPRRNERDLEDVPEELRRELTYSFADTADDVLERALEPEIAFGEPDIVGTTPAEPAVPGSPVAA
jgi:ATP-dependent Lon protease